MCGLDTVSLKPVIHNLFYILLGREICQKMETMIFQVGSSGFDMRLPSIHKTIGH